MKALEKDRTRRYETANELARDVERYLNDEPVAGLPAVGLVSLPQVHAAAQGGAADHRGGGPGVAAGRRRRELGAPGPGSAIAESCPVAGPRRNKP